MKTINMDCVRPRFASCVIDLLFDDKRTIDVRWLKEDQDFNFLLVTRSVWVRGGMDPKRM